MVCAIGFLVSTQCVVALTTAAAQAPGGGRIAPKQVFGALVNGKTGRASPVTIQMGCFGAEKPGQTGHPLKGQTLTVFRPEDIVGRFGDTGAHGHSIWAFFGPPPPSATAASGGPVVFKRYGAKAVPTSEVLPCSGSGHVSFVPFPRSPKSERDVVIPVVYVGQP